MPAGSLLKLPVDITHETAAAMTMRGLSAAYWLLKTNPWMKAGDTILIHAAAGGVGLIASQWAKLLGLRVIGTVSTEEKAELAKAHGCDEIIFYRRESVPDRVRALTNGEGVTTVYDTVGKDTYEGSLKSLKRRGVLVGCGTASGPFPPIDALQLALQGSVYFTRPALADYIASPAERAELSDALFDHVAAGRIRINVNQRYALDDAVQAHRDLEAGRTTGSSILIP
jgi:NADPH2:quinone reductase